MNVDRPAPPAAPGEQVLVERADLERIFRAAEALYGPEAGARVLDPLTRLLTLETVQPPAELTRLQAWLSGPEVPRQVDMPGRALVELLRDVMTHSPEERELRAAQAEVERARTRVEAERRSVQFAADAQWAEMDLRAAQRTLTQAEDRLTRARASAGQASGGAGA